MFPWMSSSLAALDQVQKATLAAASKSMALTVRLMGLSPEQEGAPEVRDRRFSGDVWRENPIAGAARDSYLIAAEWLEALAGSWSVIDPRLGQEMTFWTRQMVDALSPTNSPFTNPEIWEEATRTGGMSLVQGWQNLLRDLEDGRIRQVPEGAFEVGRDLAITTGQVVFRNELIELIQYTPTTEQVRSIPILVVPPWINKYYVMDMEPANSMFKFLVDSGFTVFTISWKNPEGDVLDLSWDDYLELGPLTALQIVKSITGAEKVNAVGYCLGGIALQVALGYLAATGDDPVNSATFFTTHQDFSQSGDIAVFLSEPWVAFLEWLMEASGGYLDGRRMALTFNSLRANDFLWPYVINNYLLGKDPAPFALLHWNSDGTRVPGKVHSTLIRDFFQENLLMQPNGLQVRGQGIDLGKIQTPAYAVSALRDHIVPWQGAYKIRELMGGPVRFILTEGGHIAGIINPPSRKRKRKFWVNDLETSDPEAWLEGATAREESWWEDWAAWLQERSGELIAPPATGSEGYPPLMAAPGRYVRES